MLSPENIKSPLLIPDHAAATSATKGFVKATNGTQLGNLRKLVDRIIDVAESEGIAAGEDTPLCLPVAPESAPIIWKRCEATIKLLDE